MNTGDPPFVEEDCQSYCSDSSSIPSTLSDCEGVLLSDLQFSEQNSSYSHDFRWLLTQSKPEPSLTSVEDGSNLPLSLGAPLNPSHYSGITPGTSVHESVKVPSFERDLLPLTEEDLLLSTSTSDQILGPAILDCEQPGPSSVMSRTLPVKLRDRAQFSLSIYPSPTPQSGPSSAGRADPISQKDPPSVNTLPHFPHRHVERGSKESVCKTLVSSCSDQSISSHSSLEPKETVSIARCVSDRSSPEEVEFRNERKQSQPSQSQQTAFPIPPLPEQAESLMKHIDTLSMPTVSPDSGIFASSPSGNDSPGSVTSVTASETVVDPQISSSNIHTQIQPFEAKEQRQQELVHPSPQSLHTIVCTEEDKVSEQVEKVHEQVQSALNESLSEDVLLEPDQCHVDRVASELPSPFRGPSIGRKKRGRPPKRNKSQMLQHKKSTLYSGVYTSDGISSSAVVSVPAAFNDVSETTGKEKSEDDQATQESLPESSCKETSDLPGSTISNESEDKDECKVDKDDDKVDKDGSKVDKGNSNTETTLNRSEKTQNTAESPAESASDQPHRPSSKKRKPGRPRGSKRKSFFTVVKNRAWKAKIKEGLIPVPIAIETVFKGKADAKLSDKKNKSKNKSNVQGSINSKTEFPKLNFPPKGLATKFKTPSKFQSKQDGNFSRELSNTNVKTRNETVTLIKRGRGRPRKQIVADTPNTLESKEDNIQDSVSNSALSNKDTIIRGKQLLQEKSKAEADSELASLIQSVQHSIQSQFASRDIDESSEFAMDTNSDIQGIEPSLPQANVKSTVAKITRTPALKTTIKRPSKKPKIHVMMRRTKRRKKKHVQKVTKPAEPPASVPPVETEEESQTNSSYQDPGESQSVSELSGSLFGPASSKPLGFFNRYRQSKFLKQSSFRLHSSALGCALNRNGEDSSDDDRDGSEGRKRKKKKKLLYFKSKHKNIVDPAFVAELTSLETSMNALAVSEQAFIRVKPGEVPLPSIFRITVIDVKKKKKDKQVLEPPPVPEKSKKIKVKKDSKEHEPPMPELVKEKTKSVRKKSVAEDNHPPSLEIQVSREQCLPPKKRHRMMYEAESTEEPVTAPTEVPVLPEKRKVGRPRKTAVCDSPSVSGKPLQPDVKNDGCKPVLDRPSPVTCPTRLSLKKTRHCSGSTSSSEKPEDVADAKSSQSSCASLALACPRHAHQKPTSDMTSCAECTLLAQSQPEPVSSRSHTRQQHTAQNNKPHTGKSYKSKLSLLRKKKLTAKQSCSKSGESRGGSALISPSTSPRSRTKMIAAALPSAEVVINPLPDSAVASSHSTRRSLNMQCNTSNFSDSGAEDESVIRSVCSEFEPLPLEHCLKRKSSEAATPNRSKRRYRDSSGCEDSSQKLICDSGVKRHSDDSQPPRKRYQRVGLYSDFYKDDEPKKRNETMLRNQNKVSYTKGDLAPSLLPPPIHFGKHFRETTIDFQLPYDIWWLYTHDMLHKKEALRPKFKKIRNNVYVDVKPNTRKFEAHPCMCKPPTNAKEKGCLEDCLNRVVFTECTPETCPCGEYCSNQRIQRQEWAQDVEKFLTPDRGFGVRTRTAIPNDQIILEYLGEVVSDHEFRRRMSEEYAQDSHHYCLNMDGRTVIDGYRMGNLTRFVNHACKPNCEMQKWNVNGLYHMVLKTQREIKPYEEITYDYNFHSFNMEAQQECRCGSEECRGVIGGKFQRNGQKQGQLVEGFPQVSPSMKPMSQRERLYARKHSIFLVRNIDRARGDRNQGDGSMQEKTEEQSTLEKVPDLLSMKDSMNDNRSVRTRLVSLAEENPELQRRHRLAMIFHNVYNSVASFRDEEGSLLATPLMVLPSRKKFPDYYQTITDPIDLTTIRNNIKRGYYDIHTFDADFLRLFTNVEKYCGRKSTMDRVIGRLRGVYQTACAQAIPQVEEVTGEGVSTLSSTAPSESDSTEEIEAKAQPVAEDEDEDIIRCICGVYRDEGLMIQCEQCYIWQHCDCVKVSASDAERDDVRYRCELCDNRTVEKEILDPNKKDQLGPNGEKCKHFLTLLRDDLQVAQGDCVYLMRDFKKQAKSSLRLAAAFTSPDKMDIFRVEELFKNTKGERFATGNMYLRPHETYHEPNRKFFHNELFRYPQYETYPLEQVAGKCMVMDLNTYCKGSPKGFDMRDIYICEFRVDKSARIFTKITKKFPINTKSFCFDKYPKRLCPKRTYEPHAVPQEYLRRASDKSSDVRNARKPAAEDVCKTESRTEGTAGVGKSESKIEARCDGKGDTKTEKKVEEREMKRVKVDKDALPFKMEEDKKTAKMQRLEKYLQKLQGDCPGRQRVDLSYLFEESHGRRQRKKTTVS